MKNTAKYAWSFSRNSSFLRGLFYYAAPCSSSLSWWNQADSSWGGDLSPSSIHPPASSASFSSYDNHDDDRPSSPALPSDIDPTSTKSSNTIQTYKDDRATASSKKKQATPASRPNGTRPATKKMSFAMFTNKLNTGTPPGGRLRKLSKVKKIRKTSIVSL